MKYVGIILMFVPILIMGCDATPEKSGDAGTVHGDPVADATSVGPNTTLDSDIVEYGAAEATYIAHLTDRAKALGQRELGRMAAAELIYRNSTEFHELKGPIFQPGAGVNLKMYRNFTDYTIEDIYRSESYLYPVAYEIRFFYDLLSTPPRPASLPNSFTLAVKDMEFGLRGRYSLVRRYRADRNGNYTGHLPALPPRPNFYRQGRIDEEPNAAPKNQLPPGGPMLSGPGLAGQLPIAPPLGNLPPVGGGSF